MIDVLRCTNEILFVNDGISRIISDTFPFVRYWEYIEENDGFTYEKRIKVQRVMMLLTFLKLIIVNVNMKNMREKFC